MPLTLSALRPIAPLPLCLLAGLACAQDTRTLTGSLSLRERIALPQDTQAVVELRRPDGSFVTEWREDLGTRQPPVSFSVTGPAGVDLVLHGALLAGPDRAWVTGPMPIAADAGEKGDGDDLGLLMTRAWPPLAFALALRCGDTDLRMGFTAEGVRLDIGGRLIDLAPAVAASGAKYAAADDPETWVWWKGDRVEGISIRLAGADPGACRQAVPEGLLPLTARGNEPSWIVVLAEDGAVYDGPGGRFEGPMPAVGRSDDEGRSVDLGGRVLDLRAGLCHDTMTGMPYPLTAAVTVGGQTHPGCAGDPAALLTGAEWQVAEINGAPLPEGVAATLAFGKDGRLAGAAPCNRMAAGYELTGEGLRITRAAATLMACPPPQMEAEAGFFDTLARVDGFDIAADGALVLHAAGTPVIRARR
ncbi:META domain-containing protein [Ruixingdingia sedimenti]|uniref:META domain-containing protein n=1 Tax=Ruixingdingia sedimenti TaxID=3073604 RepID=A0ABU1F5M7_9RHOB|nr:META domain-containing protein [Xinfangfangia sp. LG-4]MDR5651953.1 META domain-containing protein [Xinfangfangia sp. LG-4]